MMVRVVVMVRVVMVPLVMVQVRFGLELDAENSQTAEDVAQGRYNRAQAISWCEKPRDIRQ